MAKQPTLSERVAIIETEHRFLLDAIAANALAAQKVLDRLDEMEQKSSERHVALAEELSLHKQDYAALKNKGIGAAAVLGVFFAGLGFLIHKLWDKAVGVFT